MRTTSSRYPARNAQAPWQARRLALLQQLAIRERAVNRSWCPKIGKGVASNTEGGDLQRLIDEGLATLVQRGGGGSVRQRLASGELSPRKRTFSTAKTVRLTEAGRALLAQVTPTPERVAQPWAKRRAALREAGLA